VLSMLIMTAPPMAAMFFSGTLGSFVPYSQLTTNAPARAQAAPPGYAGTVSAMGGDPRSNVQGGQAINFDASVLPRGLAAQGFVDEKKSAPRPPGAN